MPFWSSLDAPDTFPIKRYLWVLMLIFVLVVALGSALGYSLQALLLGSLAVVVPQVYFAGCFVRTRTKTPIKMVSSMYWAEASKWVLTMCALVVAFRTVDPMHYATVFAAFVLMYVGLRLDVMWQVWRARSVDV